MPNPVMDALLARRSCRNFYSEEVPREMIEQVVNAGLHAASGMGRQATKILVVANKEMRDFIAGRNREIGGWKTDFDPFYGAPVVLIVLADKSVPTSLYDGSLVIGNMLLAAHSLGLGSIWVHRAKEEFESDDGKALLQSLGVEGDWEGVGHCCIGFPGAPNPPAPPRKPGRVVWVE